MNYSTDTLLNDDFFAMIIVMIFGFILFFALFLNYYIPFKRERDNIKMEIARSGKEEEYRYWKRKLKNLYLSSIPLIGRFFR